MSIFARVQLFVFALVMAPLVVAGPTDVVIADGDVRITYAEFEAALEMTPEKIRSLSANDIADRFDLLTSMLQIRKMAKVADALGPDTPGYWELQFQVLSAKKQFVFDRELGAYKVPNVDALASEYYETQKDKYATKPELRKSSHILIASRPGLPRGEPRAKAQKILDALRNGADFEDMVAEYSDDPGSKARGGQLTSWMRFGEPGVTPPYTEALFEITNIGDYSEITDSQFGIHIIRLDGIQEGGYYSFEEVRNDIFKDIVAEYRSLATKDINARYGISDDAFIDGDAMEELFEPYK
ncbi:peptidylprolyl isomerase [Congregibacter variabilis]|uniref:peptidylprolyl isomerase n=1 Tax=Congregibacter variabilis TaxID=3081200 RepID=A0ABZ0I3N6_9GAMM|nr:peptidylprolyl isomerase [Congregibacter sp. IMCC43200]